MVETLELLECPATQSSLRLVSPNTLAGKSGLTYPIREGVFCFAAEDGGTEAISSVGQYYDRFGWQQDEHGEFCESKTMLDTRELSIAYTRKCIARLGKYFEQGGKYLLDAGCGPLPHEELLEYGERYDKRICVDLSFQALKIAKAKLGEKGIYLQADVSNLPIKSDSIDAVTCNHVIYQVPSHLQAAALSELWRVLKPGGVCVAIYLWPNPQLPRYLRRLSRLLGIRVDAQETGGSTASSTLPETSHNNPYPPAWFSSQKWPFQYKYDTFRVVDNSFMRHCISNDWRGRALLGAFYSLQVLAPGFCGRHGSMPAIVFRKPGRGDDLT
jgi:ubiquinone/menaquinone biosynthesis C-methylase UbiE